MRALKIVGIGLLAILGLAIVAGLIGATVYWWKPVGVNRYVNKQMIRLATDSPELLTSIGAIDGTPLDFHSGKLGSYTRAQQELSIAKLREARAGLDAYCDEPGALDRQERLTCEITAWFLDDQLAGADRAENGYPISQLSGPQVDLPSFLTDQHKMTSPKLARRYVQRVGELARVLDETGVRVDEAAANGVVAPDFVLEKTIQGMRSFIEPAPADNPLVTTLPDRLVGIDGLPEAERAEIVSETERVVAEQVYPAYERLIAQQERLLEAATHEAGIWRIPDGEAIYAEALRSNTTTDMTPDEVHRLGLSEVARIEGGMAAILAAEGLTAGSVSERVQALMTDPDRQFPNTDEGRAEMIAYLDELNDKVMEKAPGYFETIPPQPVEIVRVPAFSEASAPGGYYQQAALDGSRPGRFYINLANTADNPRWTLPTLLYHEAAPGHHFQISRAQLIKDVPLLRQFSPFSAYNEGWALYAERLAAEDMGMYEDDPLGDLGRLQAEMFRAVRLVVDTGMHAKRWSREEAIDYMAEKTGMTRDEVTREIERYVVWPGQATAYKSGQLAILGIRAEAEEALGADFDLRAFNEALLADGSMPLGILEEKMRAWTAEQRPGS